MRNDAQKGEMKAQHSFEMLAQSLKNELAIDGKAYRSPGLRRGLRRDTARLPAGSVLCMVRHCKLLMVLCLFKA